MTGKSGSFLLLFTAGLAAVQAAFNKQTYVDAHNVLAATAGSIYVANQWSSFSKDRTPLAKHTPTLTIDKDNVAKITVRHASNSAHWIEAIWVEDTKGTVCGGCEFPAGTDLVENSCLIQLPGACSDPDEVIPFEYCNLHGLWQGQKASVIAWTALASYWMQHAALNLTPNVPKSRADETVTKHTPTAEVTFDDSSVATVHVEVKHGSSSTHWIESIFLIDQNNELYLTKMDKPTENGSYDSVVATQTFVLPKHVTEVTPYEACNLHGVWVGSPVSTSAPTKAPTTAPNKAPTTVPIKAPTTKAPMKAPTEAPLEITFTAKLTFAEELKDDVIVDLSVAIADKVADDLSVPEDYVKAVMILETSRARRLLTVIYDVEISITIPPAEVATIAKENQQILQLCNAANSETMADSFASSFGSLPALTKANGGVEVTASVEVKVAHVPESLETLVKEEIVDPSSAETTTASAAAVVCASLALTFNV